VNAGRVVLDKRGFLPAQTPISGAGLRRIDRWPKPAVFSKTGSEINNTNGLKQRQNAKREMRRMIDLATRGQLKSGVITSMGKILQVKLESGHITARAYNPLEVEILPP
jgi:hypothetical protein